MLFFAAAGGKKREKIYKNEFFTKLLILQICSCNFVWVLL